MHNPREHGHAVAFNNAGELPLARNNKIIADDGAVVSLFHIGIGGPGAFLTDPDVATTFNAGGTPVAIFSDRHESFELRGRTHLAGVRV